MEEELRSATNKYARVNIIRKYMNAYSDYIMIGNKQYDIDTGTYTNTFYTKILCFTCNVKCEENIINGTWSWAYVQNNGNNCVKYQKCKSVSYTHLPQTSRLFSRDYREPRCIGSCNPFSLSFQ